MSVPIPHRSFGILSCGSNHSDTNTGFDTDTVPDSGFDSGFVPCYSSDIDFGMETGFYFDTSTVFDVDTVPDSDSDFDSSFVPGYCSDNDFGMEAGFYSDIVL